MAQRFRGCGKTLSDIGFGVAQRFSAAIDAAHNVPALAAAVLFQQRRRWTLSLVVAAILAGSCSAATKPHLITFGKWIPLQWSPATSEDKPLSIKVRPLFVDGRTKEYVTGQPHEITERLFAVRRMFRINDSLPDDPAPKWQWQRGGWLLVDRVTGRVSPITLPDFDVIYSSTTWYRDYVAYCGVSDDGQKTFAMVAQLNRRKPVLKKALTEDIADDAAPDSACRPPAWQRSPTRVTFEPKGGTKQTFSIRGHVVDVVNDDDEE